MKKFRELLPILACRGLSLKTRGYDYNACVRSALLYATTTWTATQEDVSRLNRKDMMMIRWICFTKLADKIPSDELRSRFGLCCIENVLTRGRLHWDGHLQCMDADTWPRKGLKTIVTGSNPRGRPRKTWLECIRSDLKVKGLEASLAQNRIEWRWVLNPMKT